MDLQLRYYQRVLSTYQKDQSVPTVRDFERLVIRDKLIKPFLPGHSGNRSEEGSHCGDADNFGFQQSWCWRRSVHHQHDQYWLHGRPTDLRDIHESDRYSDPGRLPSGLHVWRTASNVLSSVIAMLRQYYHSPCLLIHYHLGDERNAVINIPKYIKHRRHYDTSPKSFDNTYLFSRNFNLRAGSHVYSSILYPRTSDFNPQLCSWDKFYSCFCLTVLSWSGFILAHKYSYFDQPNRSYFFFSASCTIKHEHFYPG